MNMKKMSLRLVLFFVFCFCSVSIFVFSYLFVHFQENSHVNYRPIIGILSQEFSENSSEFEKSFIMTSYVKFVEASGARAVPVLAYKPKLYYQEILNKVNGILLPGGGDLLNSTGYGRAGKIIFDIAVEMNDGGSHFPVWGTCLGFELLNLAAAKKMWMQRCTADDLALNINFTEGFADSRMFSNLPIQLRDKMQREKLTIHLHHWCLTPQNYKLSGLDKYFRVLALSTDSENNTFVSIIEAFKYPFYGVTFHPEKVVYDWTPYAVPIPHTAAAVEASHFFGDFFISEARKNFHEFPSKREEDSTLIYNYSPQRDATGTDPSAQMYIFQL